MPANQARAYFQKISFSTMLALCSLASRQKAAGEFSPLRLIFSTQAWASGSLSAARNAEPMSCHSSPLTAGALTCPFARHSKASLCSPVEQNPVVGHVAYY